MSWNAVRFSPQQSPKEGHVESYFFKLNDPIGQRALWIKGTLLARPGKIPQAEAWAIAFDRTTHPRAVKETYPIGAQWSDDLYFSDRDLDIRMGAVHLREGQITGTLRGKTTIRWDLRYESLQGPLLPFPSSSMYSGAFPRSKLVSPSPDARFWGWYEVDGLRVEVENWRGMQGHNWGKSHAYRYVWAHCNQFEERDDFVFEGLTGQVRVGPLRTPPITLLCLRMRGVRYEWNRLQDWLQTSANMTFRTWNFRTRNDLGSLEGSLEATHQDLVGLTYENPRGPATYCLNSKLALARITFCPAGRSPIHLTSKGAALEIGTTDPAHGVQVYL